LTADGLFNSNSVDPSSKLWYQAPSSWPGATYSQGGSVTQPAPVANWPQTNGFPIVDKNNFSCNLNDDIYVRAVPDSSWGTLPIPQLVLSFNAVFGRPATSSHGGDTMPTPFVLQSGFGQGANSPCAFFAWPSTAPTATDGSWIYYLGEPSQNAIGQKGGGGVSDPNRVCTYSFIVGAYVGFGTANGYTFGHDPQMEIKG
jgi:hypothetical protein